MGIATLENLWNSPYPRLVRVRPLWRFAQVRNLSVPVLESSGLYLLIAAGKPLAPHELRNLDRIMALLITTIGPQHYKRYRKVYNELQATLEQAVGRQPALDAKIETWNEELQKLRRGARSVR